jgi:ribosomal protein L29
MKKLTKELTSKTVKELEKLIQTLREEIAKLVLNKKVNPSKDTNLLRKKRKSLAVMLAVLTQKKELEAIKSK